MRTVDRASTPTSSVKNDYFHDKFCEKRPVKTRISEKLASLWMSNILLYYYILKYADFPKAKRSGEQ